MEKSTNKWCAEFGDMIFIAETQREAIEKLQDYIKKNPSVPTRAVYVYQEGCPRYFPLVARYNKL